MFVFSVVAGTGGRRSGGLHARFVEVVFVNSDLLGVCVKSLGGVGGGGGGGGGDGSVPGRAGWLGW